MTEIPIDSSELPSRALFDTGVIIRALGHRPTDVRSPQCKALWDAMITEDKQILVAAPTIAEIMRHDGKQGIPRTRGVEVVAFDSRAAEELGKRFAEAVLESERIRTGLPRHYIKYDALIVACAIRHRATHIVTLDTRLPNFAQQAGISIVAPDAFTPRQIRLSV